MINYTGVPFTNTPASKRFITENAAKAIPGSAIFFASGIDDRMIELAVSLFMAAYPRGKGTKGDPLKRAFYSACHLLHANRTKSPSFIRHESRILGVTDGFSTAEYNLLQALPEDGSVISAKGMSSIAVDGMLNRDLVAGTFGDETDNFRAATLWLTDLGIEARRISLARRTAEANQQIAASVQMHTTDRLIGGHSVVIAYADQTITIKGKTADAVDALGERIKSLLIADIQQNG